MLIKVITILAHPHHLFFTINIDLNIGNQLFLTDFVSKIDKDFITILKNSKYVGDLENEFEQQIREQAFGHYKSNEELSLVLSNNKECKNGSYVYVTENVLGISMPVAHVTGGHVEFEIDFSELKEPPL
ncbi:hypothetical protein [Lysinibacillus antri]|uniref:DUF3298 domain-containing protein n=1 Tax=Lysinibacillus antri TaxID=2498145 RepID=A0A3S0RUA2_9BACI|nr:hypothetical protein [Lysinibacillus antri]RUL49328.1 hypothetical protein EK386_15570 [Lysinibacillus antri]